MAFNFSHSCVYKFFLNELFFSFLASSKSHVMCDGENVLRAPSLILLNITKSLTFFRTTNIYSNVSTEYFISSPDFNVFFIYFHFFVMFTLYITLISYDYVNLTFHRSVDFAFCCCLFCVLSVHFILF